MLLIRKDKVVKDCDMPVDGVTVIVGESLFLLNYLLRGIANSVIGIKNVDTLVNHIRMVSGIILDNTNIINTENIVKESDILEKEAIIYMLYSQRPEFKTEGEIYANVYENFGGGCHPEIQVRMVERLRGKAVLSTNSPYVLQALNIRKEDLNITFMERVKEDNKLKLINHQKDCRELFLSLSRVLDRLVHGKPFKEV